METCIVELRLHRTSGFDIIKSALVPYHGSRPIDMTDVDVRRFDGYELSFDFCGGYWGAATMSKKFNGSAPITCTGEDNDAIIKALENSSFKKVDKLDYEDFDENDNVVCFSKILQLDLK